MVQQLEYVIIFSQRQNCVKPPEVFSKWSQVINFQIGVKNL